MGTFRILDSAITWQKFQPLQGCPQCLYSRFCIHMAAVEGCHYGSVKKINNAAVMPFPSVFHKNICKIRAPFYIWFFCMEFSVQVIFKFFIITALFACRFFRCYCGSDSPAPAYILIQSYCLGLFLPAANKPSSSCIPGFQSIHGIIGVSCF